MVRLGVSNRVLIGAGGFGGGFSAIWYSLNQRFGLGGGGVVGLAAVGCSEWMEICEGNSRL